MSYNDNVMECWQSGNAPDSKSGEPSFPWRAGSNPVHSLEFLASVWEKTNFQIPKDDQSNS